MPKTTKKPMMTARNRRRGQRAKDFRDNMRLTHKDVAHIISQSALSRLENSGALPRGQVLRDLADAYGVTPASILFDPEVRSQFPSRVRNNPKPLGFGGRKIEQVYVVVGSPGATIDVSTRYINEPFVCAPRIEAAKDELLTIAEQQTKAAGGMYFDGPTARLLRYSDATSDTQAGFERRKLVLDVGPLSWFDFLACNTFLDRPQGKSPTFRTEFATLDRLAAQPHDLSWYRLGGIMQVAMTPITTDGYGIVSRTRSGLIPATHRKRTVGVAENMQRWLDEAQEDDKWEALHEIAPIRELPPAGKRREYKPKAVSPYLTAIRGLQEEVFDVSPELDVRKAVKFLSLVWDLVLFHPLLVGVIELPVNRDKAEQLLRERRGKDHSESFEDAGFLRLDSTDKATVGAVLDVPDWDVGGLASIVHAIEYWELKNGLRKP